MRRWTGVSVIRRRMSPRSTRQTGSQRRLGGNARSFLSRYIVVSLSLSLSLCVRVCTHFVEFFFGINYFNNLVL